MLHWIFILWNILCLSIIFRTDTNHVVISQALCYLLYINRLFYTFDGTNHQLRNRTLLSLYILIGFFVLCHLGISIIFILEHKDNSLFNWHSAGLLILFSLFHLLLCFSYLFIYKINQANGMQYFIF